jgi:hypothetical protein
LCAAEMRLRAEVNRPVRTHRAAVAEDSLTTTPESQLGRHPTRLACQAAALVGLVWVVGNAICSLKCCRVCRQWCKQPRSRLNKLRWAAV